MEPKKSYLSRTAILSEIKAGKIFISPFNEQNLGSGQYDVSLGPYVYRENRDVRNIAVYNPYSERDVRRIWGDTWQEAIRHEDWCMHNKVKPLENIAADDRIVVLDPHETILAHTEEFIGGCDNTNTTMMKARSSLGRNFIEVCKCAGLGDIGYCNRWTMEITNNSQKYQIPLVVGRRIAQIIFFKTDGIKGKDYVKAGGKYQTTGNLDKMMKEWTPEAMLPKMYRDREVRALKETSKREGGFGITNPI